MKIQRREMEVRAVMEPEQTDSRIVEGYAVRFNEPANFTVGDTEYREIIDRMALDKTDMSDVPMKYNHSDSFMIMARTRNKTLQLLTDDNGLKIRAQLADTTDGRDLYELIKRGDVDKMSFAFTVRKDDYNNKTHTRTIRDIDKLYDVSAVDFPAYDTTSISARSFFELESENERKELDRTEARRRKQQQIKSLLELWRK
jgi:HK97 family phage prohead protease